MGGSPVRWTENVRTGDWRQAKLPVPIRKREVQCRLMGRAEAGRGMRRRPWEVRVVCGESGSLLLVAGSSCWDETRGKTLRCKEKGEKDSACPLEERNEVAGQVTQPWRGNMTCWKMQDFRQTWAQIPSMLLISRVTVSKLLSLSTLWAAQPCATYTTRAGVASCVYWNYAQEEGHACWKATMPCLGGAADTQDRLQLGRARGSRRWSGACCTSSSQPFVSPVRLLSS